mgnify:CR=1 FL=1
MRIFATGTNAVDESITSCDMRQQAMSRALRSRSGQFLAKKLPFIILLVLVVILSVVVESIAIAARLVLLITLIVFVIAAGLFLLERLSVSRWLPKPLKRLLWPFSVLFETRGMLVNVFASCGVIASVFMFLLYVRLYSVGAHPSELIYLVPAALTVLSVVALMFKTYRFPFGENSRIRVVILRLFDLTINRRFEVPYEYMGETYSMNVGLVKAFFMMIGVCKVYVPLDHNND